MPKRPRLELYSSPVTFCSVLDWPSPAFAARHRNCCCELSLFVLLFVGGPSFGGHGLSRSAVAFFCCGIVSSQTKCCVCMSSRQVAETAPLLHPSDASTIHTRIVPIRAPNPTINWNGRTEGIDEHNIRLALHKH